MLLRSPSILFLSPLFLPALLFAAQLLRAALFLAALLVQSALIFSPAIITHCAILTKLERNLFIVAAIVAVIAALFLIL